MERRPVTRVVESREPWITKVLVVGGRGRPEHLEAYDEMQLLYSKSNDFERGLSRSYLLEHGVSAMQVTAEINNNVQKKK